MNVPIALPPEDLKAGKVDVAVIGAGLDLSIGQRGTSFGLRAVRTAERYLPGGPLAPAVMTHSRVMIRPFEVVKIVDYGDACVNPFDIEASHEGVRKQVREIVDVRAIPLVI